jgi:hypothetical protein
LPKKYLTNKLFYLFELFSKYEVFLEIAIPTIINNIENDISQYQSFTNIILWDVNDRNKFLNKEYIYNSLNHNHNFILHPIKFDSNLNSKDWLIDIFCKEKCVIITTINKPTEAILKHINNNEYDVIIVGDNKTPDDYNFLNCNKINTSHELVFLTFKRFKYFFGQQVVSVVLKADRTAAKRAFTFTPSAETGYAVGSIAHNYSTVVYIPSRNLNGVI